MYENLIGILKEDADLLTMSDQWLEEEKNHLMAEMEKSSKELLPILTAIELKRRLQEKNLVLKHRIVRDETGTARDIVLDICKLSTALEELNFNDEDCLAAYRDLCTWHIDGYDIHTTLDNI